MMTSRPTRSESFLDIAYVLAQRSTCVRRRVGAVLTDAYTHIIGTGYNGVPKGYKHCIDQPCGGHTHSSGKGLESCLAIHAEQNALMQCPDVMKIDAIYVTTSPCMHCMKMLLNTSCQCIVYSELYDLAPLDLWHQFGRLSAHVPRNSVGSQV